MVIRMLMFAPMITIQFKLKIIIADQPDKELWLHHQVCCKVVDVSRSVHQAEYETLYCVVFFYFRKYSFKMWWWWWRWWPQDDDYYGGGLMVLNMEVNDDDDDDDDDLKMTTMMAAALWYSTWRSRGKILRRPIRRSAVISGLSRIISIINDHYHCWSQWLQW